MNYSYPIDTEWSQEEIIDVVNFLSLIEDAYERSVNTQDFMTLYRAFKQVAPMKSDENRILKSFEQVSTYSGYHAVKRAKQAKENNEKTFSMK
ncbi:UPF0223 family protein [Macrococcoides caseolyticum]|uniref:Uncharacterized protein n=2 Tax=Macrococcoides caseolyticum TaxID=69966 RepID=A0A855GKN2_9STAP|nr:UPF0223 family protein [Macrococcus caseolyticus]ARQ04154.1 hypothetical protein CA207_09000 [Macrococcus caseolyticus]MBQ5152904.1 UPF0223 family protein [Macrococcus caseolyticus]MDJ1088715.1 UPF0223 family protein [Macrococcus caseolyticus]MDJ1090087.1 UPF0223 family protein [Macrococcus caseolyticus]MDJ1154358.1 UPF0223 family protein [Macrococcus caseolyticus]